MSQTVTGRNFCKQTIACYLFSVNQTTAVVPEWTFAERVSQIGRDRCSA